MKGFHERLEFFALSAFAYDIAENTSIGVQFNELGDGVDEEVETHSWVEATDTQDLENIWGLLFVLIWRRFPGGETI